LKETRFFWLMKLFGGNVVEKIGSDAEISTTNFFIVFPARLETKSTFGILLMNLVHNIVDNMPSRQQLLAFLNLFMKQDHKHIHKHLSRLLNYTLALSQQRILLFWTTLAHYRRSWLLLNPSPKIKSRAQMTGLLSSIYISSIWWGLSSWN
jgi:hypothetical protein